MDKSRTGWARVFAAAVFASALAACGGSGGAPASPPPTSPPLPVLELTDKQKVAQLETTGQLPKLDRSVDLQGPDANGNGIRDDIDAIIASSYAGAEQRNAANQYAAALQAVILVDPTNGPAVKALSLRSMRAITCLYVKFGVGQEPLFSTVQEDLMAYTTNTKVRLLAYLRYAKALDGSVISQPEGNTCE